MDFRSLVPLRARQTPARQGVDPFTMLQTEIDRLFTDFARGIDPFAPLQMRVPTDLVPNIDVTENDKQIEVTVELPGLERKDVDITIEDGLLTIRGEKKVEVAGEASPDDKGSKEAKSGGNGADGNGKNYRVAERSYGVFVRMLQLPPGIDPNSVQATMSNGVLKVVIPKPARSEARKIEVKDEPKQDAKQVA